ncbi:hypothetical protein Cflav_PD0847 [Pedosphaera parvula Ellin514]|uniref:Uncharacterized protein n=1 Tax=Pedosphaera parvula (strain Ellin514) TaxID=320771 RepID=B9XQH2_PEDPL|nr:hypothetical protein Cflav_PD0847 [Pedosphaera parvula Ellin514]
MRNDQDLLSKYAHDEGKFFDLHFTHSLQSKPKLKLNA